MFRINCNVFKIFSFRLSPLKGHSVEYIQSTKRCRQSIHTFAEKDANADNIILMGSPGSGKTTVGRIIADRLGMPAFDIDDHHLEPYWGKTVADKLSEVGSDAFLEAEGEALLNCHVRGSVVSLTGSNPMHSKSMSRIAKSGYVIFLDVANSEILRRLEEMKINRIVGQDVGMTMVDILKYRQQFYENNYDLRIICESNETTESIATKAISALQCMKNDKGYFSTRHDKTTGNKQQRVSFNDSILSGLAPDGGLYVPSSELPKISLGELERLVSLDYKNRALRILEKLINPRDLHPSVLSSLTSNAYNEENFSCNGVFPVYNLEENHYLMELFHGPTASFKDGALQLMPQFFVKALQQKNIYRNKRFLIIVATSGDTGGAVLDGFVKHAGDCGVGVIVLYPEHGVSVVQKRQMLCLVGKNVRVLGVDSDFDKCQSLVKTALQDRTLAKELKTSYDCHLSAANSISWGRLLPQTVYHVSAYLDLVGTGVISCGQEVDICIPTGNFGNILSAYYAKKMGVPIRRLICASNSNNTVTQFINTGTYDVRTAQLQRTTSPAIDILVSSNLERYLYHITGSTELIRKWFNQLTLEKRFAVDTKVKEVIQENFMAKWCPEEKCKEMVLKTLQRSGYLLDPHTAIAKMVADYCNTRDVPVLIASTAHYAKFAPEILQFFGYETKGDSITSMYQRLQKMCQRPLMHPNMEECAKMSFVREKFLKPKYEDFVDEIKIFAKKIF